MAKFNTKTTQPGATGPITAVSAQPDTVTHEGAPAYTRDAKSELFLLGVSNLVGEDTFYEKAADRDARYRDLVRANATFDLEWTRRFLTWLRGPEANLRSAPLVGAAETVYAWTQKATQDGQQLGPDLSAKLQLLVDGVLQRADEPGELLAYWTSQGYGQLPKALKKGVARAVRKLYNEYSLAKYDSKGTAYRFGRVLDLTHPIPVDAKQGQLFKHALDRLHDRADEVPVELEMLNVRARLLAAAVEERRAVLTSPDGPAILKAAGMTWESLAGWLQGPMDQQAWETIIPSMGYMALLRNLRNFDEAGVSDAVVNQVIAILTSQENVRKSRQLPFRFWSAYQAAPSDRWAHALSTALGHSLTNIPALGGRTLVLVDTSASMSQLGYSKRSTVAPVTSAAIFGVALALKGEQVDLHGFADGTFKHDVRTGGGLLKEVARFSNRIGEVGHGTMIATSLARTFANHDRVVLISDEQTMDGTGTARDGYGGYGSGVATDVVPAHVPMYGFNLGGYKPTVIRAGTRHRHEFGGLTDATFKLLPLLERGQRADWPF